MSDSRLQELKRTWEASGSVEDEAAYLRERVRVGDLTQERLELAAYCGHEAARTAIAHAGSRTFKQLGEDEPHLFDSNPERWLEYGSHGWGLDAWGPKVKSVVLKEVVARTRRFFGPPHLAPQESAKLAEARGWIDEAESLLFHEGTGVISDPSVEEGLTSLSVFAVYAVPPDLVERAFGCSNLHELHEKCLEEQVRAVTEDLVSWALQGR